MIKFAVVHRARDGLALSASTDAEAGVELRDSKRFAKLLSRKARNYPVRSTMAVGSFRIFFTTESDICFLLISEINFAAVLAFSFLDDLKKEFLNKYTKASIDNAVRPYSFIDFDQHIQKTKQRYNNTRTLYTRIDLSQISTELKNCPPFEVPQSDLGAAAASSVVSNGTLLSAPPSTTNVIKGKLGPLTTASTISFWLTTLCALLNIVRLVPFVSQHAPSPDDEETAWMGMSFCFLASSVVNGLQCYTLMKPVRQRQLVSVLCVAMNLLLIYSLYELRNTVQIAFHLISSLFICYSTWQRPLLGKLPNYNV